jgi:hypothetical protein
MIEIIYKICSVVLMQGGSCTQSKQKAFNIKCFKCMVYDTAADNKPDQNLPHLLSQFTGRNVFHV